MHKKVSKDTGHNPITSTRPPRATVFLAEDQQALKHRESKKLTSETSSIFFLLL